MNSFNPISFYTPKNNYNLLPFKFDKWRNGNYIITNMIGEYMIISHENLIKITNGTIEHNSDICSDLRSKHFIYYKDEYAPINLLALKLRTKNHRLSQFTNLHIFVATLRCDHSCPYCQVSRQSEAKNKFDMTQEIADKSLDFVFKTPNPAIKIEFQGGEPLLNFEIIQYVVLEAKKRNVREERDLQFIISTTLSLLTEDILTFCKEHNIHLSSSLDGPQNLHNTNRPRSGSNSHQLFEKNLKMARDFLGYDKVSAIMTTTNDSLTRTTDIVDEYLRLGFKGIFLRPLSPYGFAIKTKKYMSYDIDKWLEFYKEGLEYIINLNKTGTPFVEHYSALILQKILTSSDPGFVDLSSPSGAGILAIVFNYDGYVYASDESRMLAEMNDFTFRLGNILKDTYAEIVLSDKLLDTLDLSFSKSLPMCSDCSFESYCGTDPVFHHTLYGDVIGKKPTSAFCKKNMTIFKHLIHLMEKDKWTKDLFIRWANKC